MGQRSRQETKRQADDRRGSARERGYDSRWDKARRTFLAGHPLCRMCERAGHITAATVVDHIKPHRGDQSLFWDADNWQPLCKTHHDGVKQREERESRAAGKEADVQTAAPRGAWSRRGRP